MAPDIAEEMTGDSDRLKSKDIKGPKLRGLADSKAANFGTLDKPFKSRGLGGHDSGNRCCCEQIR